MKTNEWTNIRLTLVCKWASICLHSNNWLTTTECPFSEAADNAVYPSYGGHQEKENQPKIYWSEYWKNNEWTNIVLTLACKLTSICLHSNNRLTTSECPFSEAPNNAVYPSYGGHQEKENHPKIYWSEYWKNNEWTNIRLTSSCRLTSICLHCNNRLTTPECPFCEASNNAVYPYYIVIKKNKIIQRCTEANIKNTMDEQTLDWP